MHILNFSQYFIRNLRTVGEEFGVDPGQGDAAGELSQTRTKCLLFLKNNHVLNLYREVAEHLDEPES